MSFVTFLIDDDAKVLTALRRLLAASGYEARAFSSPDEFLAAYDPNVAGCAIVDVTMPKVDGLALQQKLYDSYPDCPVIFLTGTGDIARSVKAMKAGAVDFLTKPADGAELVAAVERAKERYTQARALREEREMLDRRFARLTPREREVLEHVVLGQINKQIAAQLGTVEKTIKVHRGRVMAKLEVRSVAELIHLTERAGLRPAGRIGP